MSNNLTNFYSFSQEGPGKLAIHFQDQLYVGRRTAYKGIQRAVANS